MVMIPLYTDILVQAGTYIGSKQIAFAWAGDVGP